jgi:hypothetical protein
MKSEELEQLSRRQALKTATAGAVAVGVASIGHLIADDEPKASKESTLKEDLTLVREGRALAIVTVEKEATAAEQRGARELRDHLEQLSGARLEIAGDATEKVEIRVAFDAKLGPEEYRLKTGTRQVLVTGGRPRGVLYGCYELLERLGLRWYTPTATSIPKRATVTVPPLDERGAPVFENRHVMSTESDDPDWAARSRLNGASKRLDASYGGSFLYHPFVHSLNEVVPGTLRKQHPEYFPLIDGERFIATDAKHTFEGVQRCLTNPDVVRLAVAKVRQWIKEVPNARIISVSQNDGDGWCECDDCRKIVDNHGARSGVLLAFVNEVAAAIAKDHPEKLIDTIAYGETEAPPKGVSPRDNVSVRLCPIHVCHAHPLEICESPESRAFLGRLKGWAAITQNLAVWHYACPAHFLMPFPDFTSFPADLRLYRKHGATNIFVQGTFVPGGGQADAELRAWVVSRLLWNPDADADALVTEWMKGVYGPAWEPMRTWFDRLHREAADAKRHLYLQDNPFHSILTDELRAAGDDLFERAAKIADTDSRRNAVAKARLSLSYVKLQRAKVPGSDLEEFLALAKRFGLTHAAEGRPLEDWAGELRKRGK